VLDVLAQARPGYEFRLLHRLPERQSKCELEVDACVEDILNRQEVSNTHMSSCMSTTHGSAHFQVCIMSRTFTQL